MSIISVDKRSKKEQRKYYSSMRVLHGFNTGTRTMKDNKHKSRECQNTEFRRSMKGGLYE